MTKRTSKRSEQATLRRLAIVDAALDEFVEKGFAAARMEDIARRAGVAKGTIYLHFTDKEALFEAIVKQEIRPKIDTGAMAAAAGGSLREFLDSTILPSIGELAGTRRGAILRLLIGEAGRFPQLAEVYHRVVIEPGLASIRVMVKRAKESGDLCDEVLVEFPHLVVAPLLFAVVWAGLFERFQHVDLEGMARAYFDHMLSGSGQRKTLASGGKHE